MVQITRIPVTRTLGVAVLLFVLTACATPDLAPWAEATKGLKNAVAGEHRATEKRMAAVQARLMVAVPSHALVTTLSNNLADYKKNAKKIDATLNLAVTYAGTLEALAKAGEGGKEAAEKISASIKSAAAIAGTAIPGFGAAGEVFYRLFTAVSQSVTRIEAQESLEAAMSIAEEGAPAKDGKPAIAPFVPLIEEQLLALYKAAPPAGAQRIIAVGFRGNEQVANLAIAGPERVTFYRGTRSIQERVFSALAKATRRADEQTYVAALKLHLEAIERSAAVQEIAKADYDAFLDAEAEAATFEKDRIAAADAIVKAVAAWRRSHTQIYNELRKCGGLKPLTKFKECSLNVKDLEAAVGEIRDIIGK